MADMKSMKIEYPLRDVTFSEKSSDFRPHGDLPEYPYGLRLCLDNDTIKKLGVKVPNVGSKMKLMAMVEVCSTSSFNTKESGMMQTMDLQIVEMSLSSSGKKEVDPNKMYSSEEIKPEVEIEVEQGS